MGATLLVIDDEETIRRSLRHFFTGKGHRVLEASTAAQGLALALDQAPDVVLLDLKLPDMDGLGLLGKLKEALPDTEVVMFTARGTIESAVAAMKAGAADYLTKPVDLDEVEILIQRVLDVARLKRENIYYRTQGRGRQWASVPGASPPIKEINTLIDLLAQNPHTTVLIQGDSGTGKELAARALHAKSSRRDKPFLEINCAGLSDQLLESELFGHERGAFTDAKTLKRGLLEVADGGTVFLDEIGDMPPAIQPKLLRVLESRSFRRVGGTRDISVDVRIIAATNRNLADKVERGTFREDLYYRLKVMPLFMAPLRDRGTDILVLADLFVQEFNALLKKRVSGYSPPAQALLLAYHWPGNVRELRNVTERAMILCPGDHILPAHLPAEIQGLSPAEVPSAPVLNGSEAPPPTRAEAPAAGEGTTPGAAGPGTLEEMERRYITEILAQVGGNRSQAARILGISRSTLQEKIKRYGL